MVNVWAIWRLSVAKRWDWMSIGKLDHKVVDMIETHLLACWHVALLHDDGGAEAFDA